MVRHPLQPAGLPQKRRPGGDDNGTGSQAVLCQAADGCRPTFLFRNHLSDKVSSSAHPHIRTHLTSVNSTRSHVLQADTEEMFNVWITAFKEEIGALMQLMLSSRSSSGMSLNSESPRVAHESRTTDSPSGPKYINYLEISHLSWFLSWLTDWLTDWLTGGFLVECRDAEKRSSQQKMLSDILSVPGNERCCDCGAENPEWASINIGITLCIGSATKPSKSASINLNWRLIHWCCFCCCCWGSLLRSSPQSRRPHQQSEIPHVGQVGGRSISGDDVARQRHHQPDLRVPSKSDTAAARILSDE